MSNCNPTVRMICRRDFSSFERSSMNGKKRNQIRCKFAQTADSCRKPNFSPVGAFFFSSLSFTSYSLATYSAFTHLTKCIRIREEKQDKQGIGQAHKRDSSLVASLNFLKFSRPHHIKAAHAYLL